MNKIAYITAKTPFGLQEAFILTEMLALRSCGADILIIPRDNPKKLLSHNKAKELIPFAMTFPLINLAIAGTFIKYMTSNPLLLMKLIYRIAFRTRAVTIALKNLAVFPKSLYLAQTDLLKDVSHIHAHWASTTATMAYIISHLTGIPWSFTAHRWDIGEDNILEEKCRSASFVRAISERGRKEILDTIRDKTLAGKVSVLHMGVDMPDLNEKRLAFDKTFTFLCPANLYSVKGHKYLLAACSILRGSGLSFRCFIAGDGYLEEELKAVVKKLHLEDVTKFTGRLSHEELFAMYDSGIVDAVVLPSIVTADGEQEGIPVVLMEAMSYGIPVISTNTGGIPELLSDGSGIMVPEKDPYAIACALVRLYEDAAYRISVAKRGRAKVLAGYSALHVADELYGMFA